MVKKRHREGELKEGETLRERERAREMASEGASSNPESVEELTMAVKWSGKEYTVRVCADDTVGELKRRICEVTNVLPKRQKLLNVKAGVKPADDTMLLSQLNLKPTIKIMMMGYGILVLVFISWIVMWVVGFEWLCSFVSSRIDRCAGIGFLWMCR